MSNALTESRGLNRKSRELVRLFISICCHKWEGVLTAAQQCLDAGAVETELRGCIRHTVVVSGYPPALAASKKLHAAKILVGALSGKAGGQPGNAFDLVYADKRDRVWENLYAVDPILSEWIRCHCYGDIYSNPGLDLRQKQLMTAAFLAEADMHEEFFGHVLAGLRFGATGDEVLEAVDVAFQVAGTADSKQDLHRHAAKLVQKAVRKIGNDFPDGVPALPEVIVDQIRTPAVPHSGA